MAIRHATQFRPRGSDSEFNDLGGWNRASFNHHPCDDLEPVDLEPNGYRAISLDFLKVMFSVDEFVTAAPDARAAVVAVGIVLRWPSVRGLSVGNIAGQLGVSATTITRACDRFREMAGFGVSVAGGVRFIRPGAGSSNATNRLRFKRSAGRVQAE